MSSQGGPVTTLQKGEEGEVNEACKFSHSLGAPPQRALGGLRVLKWSGGGVGRNGGAQKWSEESQTNAEPMVLGLKSTERPPGQLVEIHRLLGGLG